MGDEPFDYTTINGLADALDELSMNTAYTPVERRMREQYIAIRLRQCGAEVINSLEAMLTNLNEFFKEVGLPFINFPMPEMFSGLKPEDFTDG